MRLRWLVKQAWRRKRLFELYHNNHILVQHSALASPIQLMLVGQHFDEQSMDYQLIIESIITGERQLMTCRDLAADHHLLKQFGAMDAFTVGYLFGLRQAGST